MRSQIRAIEVNQQQQLQAETPQEKVDRLQHTRMLQQRQIEAETPEDKMARLKHKRQCLEAETPEQKVTRLDRMSTPQQEECLENETPEQRSVTLNQVKLNRASCFNERNGRPTPSLNDKCVKEKVNMLHKEMASTESPMCSICLEKFPGTKMAHKSSECQRCYRDKKVPKLFSAENNMSPGSVPDELQVSS